MSRSLRLVVSDVIKEEQADSFNQYTKSRMNDMTNASDAWFSKAWLSETLTPVPSIYLFIVTTADDFRKRDGTTPRKPYVMTNPMQPRPESSRCDYCRKMGYDCYDEKEDEEEECRTGRRKRIETCRGCRTKFSGCWVKAVANLTYPGST